MSRSNNNESGVKNPAKRFMEWSGAKGNFHFYDKEKAENVEVGLPFTFLVLDQLTTIKGWDDASQSAVYSNEVKNLNEQPLNVRSFKGGNVSYKGLYADIKDKLKAAGYHYVKSVYIAYFEGKELVIGNIQLKGAAVNQWIEFCNNHKSNVMKSAIEVVSAEERKKGATKFFVPIFALKDVSASEDEMATNLDRELQEYLKQYQLEKQQAPAIMDEPEPHDLGGADDLPF